MKPKRPWPVTLLAVLGLTLVAIHLTRFAAALHQWDYLSSLPLSTSPAYLAATGFFWGLVGIPVVYGLWRGPSWAPNVTVGFGLFYSLHFWLEQGFIMINPYRKTNWSFLAYFTIVCLAFMFITLSHPKVRKYFGEKNERQPQN
jgi:hypothetical protein